MSIAGPPKTTLSKPEVYAHRGVRAHEPENTLPAYEAALAAGSDWVDMDVVLTADGEVILSHDPVLNPDIVRDETGRFIFVSRELLNQLSSGPRAAFDQKYAVKNLTLAELQKFDVGRLNRKSGYAKYFPAQVGRDGIRMPTLRQVIQYVKKATGGNVGFQIEMKTDPLKPETSADPQKFAAALARVLREENVIHQTEIQAFDFRCLYALHQIDPKHQTAFLTSRDNEIGGVDDFLSQDPKIATAWSGEHRLADHRGSIPQMIKDLGGYAWEPEDAQLTQKTLKEAHELGLKVVVWSWPEKLGQAFDETITSRMIDWGVDGIITDDPGRLNQMLEKRGLRTPRKYCGGLIQN